MRRLWPMLTGVLVAVLLAGLAGRWTAPDLSQELARANARAAHFELAYSSTANAWSELAVQYEDETVLRQRLAAENERLEQSLARSDATVLHLQEIATGLRARLDSSATTVSRTDTSTFTVQLDESVAFKRGGSLRVTGDVTVETQTPTVAAQLDAEGSFPLTVVLSRGDDGDLLVNAFTGDPRLTVTRLDVTSNLDDPLRPRSQGLLNALSDQLLAPDAWINRALGFGACLLIP